MFPCVASPCILMASLRDAAAALGVPQRLRLLLRPRLRFLGFGGRSGGNRFPVNLALTRGAEDTTFWWQFYFLVFCEEGKQSAGLHWRGGGGFLGRRRTVMLTVNRNGDGFSFPICRDVSALTSCRITLMRISLLLRLFLEVLESMLYLCTFELHVLEFLFSVFIYRDVSALTSSCIEYCCGSVYFIACFWRS